MTTAKVTSKGQITLPVAIRKILGIRTGTYIDFVREKDNIVLRKTSRNSGSFKRWIGFVGNKSSKDIDNEMNLMRGRNE